ncbi:hypothetical protein [Rhodoligotrophos ferricapiens]|uniref:hypothetical protein n=1 Tax=Rhodoligotrophos ferricapiens TaxID=3069264 RepID=UPI00315C9516
MFSGKNPFNFQLSDATREMMNKPLDVRAIANAHPVTDHGHSDFAYFDRNAHSVTQTAHHNNDGLWGHR